MAWWIAQNVVVTAALALIVAVACRLLRIGPVARHALWVLVLVKFITPPLVVWPWATSLGTGLFSAETGNLGTGLFSTDPGVLGTGVPPDDSQIKLAASAQSGSPTGIATASDPIRLSLVRWILLIWIAGSLFLLILEGMRMRRLHRRVSHGSPPDEALDDRIRALAAGIGVADVRVRVVDGISSPMIWAAGRPQLLWPADLPPDSSDACIDGLIVHELAHIRRRDHVVGWIELAAGVLWWWNPLFWFVRASRREQAELACDAWVISVLPNGRRAYAESLLALSGAAVRGAPSMAVVGIRATSRRVLERRLVMIMKGSTPLRLPVMGFVGVALAAVMTLPAWAMSSQQTPPPPPPPAPAQVQTPPPPPPPPAPAVVALPTSTVPIAPGQAGPLPVAMAYPSTVPIPSALAKPVPVPQAYPATVPVPAAQQAGTPPPPPPPPPKPTKAPAKAWENVSWEPVDWVKSTSLPRTNALPAEGRQLLDQFDADRAQIQKDMAARLETRRQALIKELEALQEQYTKAGKLDEAIAVRNYLRAVKGPGAK